MKKFNWVFAISLVLILLMIAGMNVYLDSKSDESGRGYRVEINRIANKIQAGEIYDLADYSDIVGVVKLSGEYGEDFSSAIDYDYLIKEIGGDFYRFDYVYGVQKNNDIILIMNVIMGAVLLIFISIWVYIRTKILNPFNQISELPLELSKGNLTAPIKENKSRFFGRFTWGINMLRENLEEHKLKEYELYKEKKTLVLAISHDIKTPLSAIKLYSMALSKDLYRDEAKKKEIAESINKNADEIENFVTQIIKASSEDFLNLEVENGEFYLSELIGRIQNYYVEKLNLLKISFVVDDYLNCILLGDLDRSVEVLQNIIENAVKYGDGREISLSVSQEEDCRLVCVKNTGCTLSQAELPNIFNSFWRGSNIGSNGGSGLGLYICRDLMKKMDGDIFASADGDVIAVTSVFREA